METLTTRSFSRALKSEKFVLVNFTAKWCGPCKLLATVLESLSLEFKEIEFYKLDIDESQPIASKFGIKGVPTLMLFKNGQFIERFIGFSSKEEIKKDITAALAKTESQ